MRRWLRGWKSDWWCEGQNPLAPLSALNYRQRMTTLFEACGGASGIHRLAEAWHHRVLADEIVNHAFSHGYREDHVTRLALYWGEAWGGPPAYSELCGDETAVVKMHSGNGEHEEMDRRAIACFEAALADVGFDRSPRLADALLAYFTWATTSTMARYHRSADDVPNGLAIPKWSWNGQQTSEI